MLDWILDLNNQPTKNLIQRTLAGEVEKFDYKLYIR